MKHAGPRTLAALAPLRRRLSEQPSLVERTPGCFYLKAVAFLHFHEDPTGTYADVKLAGVEFTRLRSTTKKEQSRLLALVTRKLRR